MNADLEAVTAKILPILKDAGVIRAPLFGSATRGEANKDSDLDLLVELPERSSLLDLAGLKLRLEAAVGRPMDVLTFSSVHPRLRPYIERDQVAIL
jgi:predicted nucleotidyltransferase